MEGGFVPGDRVSARTLAARLRVSMMPVLIELEPQALSEFVAGGFAGADVECVHALDLRYFGQQWTIRTPLERGGESNGAKLLAGIVAILALAQPVPNLPVSRQGSTPPPPLQFAVTEFAVTEFTTDLAFPIAVSRPALLVYSTASPGPSESVSAAP